MSSGVMITGIICLTIIVLALIGSKDKENEEEYIKNKYGEYIRKK